MKKFEAPMLNVEEIVVEDVITTSPIPGIGDHETERDE